MPSIPGWVWTWLAVGAAMVAALVIPAVRLPSDEVGFRHVTTPDIGAQTTLSQTFVMTASNLEAVEVATARTGQVSGAIRFELYELTRGTPLVRATEVPAADLVKASSYRFEFPPIAESQDHPYRLDVVGAEENPPRGVALLVTKGERYGRGTMLINERERWADLAFTTFAPSGRSSWRVLMDGQLPRRGLSRVDVVIGALAAIWLALAVVLHGFWPRVS